MKWTPFDLGFAGAPAVVGDPPAPMSVRVPCVVHLNGGDITLGTVRYELASAQIESVTSAGDGVVRVRFVPGEDQTATLVYEPLQPG